MVSPKREDISKDPDVLPRDLELEQARANQSISLGELSRPNSPQMVVYAGKIPPSTLSQAGEILEFTRISVQPVKKANGRAGGEPLYSDTTCSRKHEKHMRMILWMDKTLEFGWMKPYRYWGKPSTNWCSILSIGWLLRCSALLCYTDNILLLIDHAQVRPTTSCRKPAILPT